MYELTPAWRQLLGLGHVDGRPNWHDAEFCAATLYMYIARGDTDIFTQNHSNDSKIRVQIPKEWQLTADDGSQRQCRMTVTPGARQRCGQTCARNLVASRCPTY